MTEHVRAVAGRLILEAISTLDDSATASDIVNALKTIGQ